MSTAQLRAPPNGKYSLSFVYVRSRAWHCEVFCFVIRQNKNYFSRANYYRDPRNVHCWSQWPCGLRRGSAAARLLRLWGSDPTGGMEVCRECCVLSGRGLCDGLITRPEESYRPWCVVVCDLETLWMRRLWPTGGCRAKYKTKKKMLLTGSKDSSVTRTVKLLAALSVWQSPAILPYIWQWRYPQNKITNSFKQRT